MDGFRVRRVFFWFEGFLEGNDYRMVLAQDWISKRGVKWALKYF